MAQVDQTLSIEGESGPVRVRLDHLPVRTEAGGLRHRYAYPDFGAELIVAIHRQLPFCERLGPPWRRRNACRDCSAELPADSSTAIIPLRLALREIPAFDIVFTVPALRCEVDGIVQITQDRELDFHISESMVRAFDSGHVKPG